MVTKINISIKEELLHEMDHAAKESHVSRSALLAEAIQHFLKEKEEIKAMERRKKAGAEIDMIREKLGSWDATAEVLKWRQLH